MLFTENEQTKLETLVHEFLVGALERGEFGAVDHILDDDTKAQAEVVSHVMFATVYGLALKANLAAIGQPADFRKIIPQLFALIRRMNEGGDA